MTFLNGNDPGIFECRTSCESHCIYMHPFVMIIGLEMVLYTLVV